MLIRNKLLAYLGKICYGVYLLHYPIVVILKEISVLQRIPQNVMAEILVFICYLAGTICLAILSFRYFEMPIQRQRVRFEV